MENIDFSDALAKVQEMLSGDGGENQLQGILSMLMPKEQDCGDTENGEHGAAKNTPVPSSFGQSEIDMLIKIKKIMSVMNDGGTTAGVTFLESLRPLLKKERRLKIENAIKIMNMAKVLKAFRELNEGGG